MAKNQQYLDTLYVELNMLRLWMKKMVGYNLTEKQGTNLPVSRSKMLHILGQLLHKLLRNVMAYRNLWLMMK